MTLGDEQRFRAREVPPCAGGLTVEALDQQHAFAAQRHQPRIGHLNAARLRKTQRGVLHGADVDLVALGWKLRDPVPAIVLNDCLKARSADASTRLEESPHPFVDRLMNLDRMGGIDQRFKIGGIERPIPRRRAQAFGVS
jgi:hypothetical protein